MTSILLTKYVIYILMSLIIVDMLSLSDRRSSGFCSDSERRESLGSGRHGLVTKMVFYHIFCIFECKGWSQRVSLFGFCFFLVICILKGMGKSQRCFLCFCFLLFCCCFFWSFAFWKARVGHKGVILLSFLFLLFVFFLVI